MEDAIGCAEDLELLAGSRHDAITHLHRDSTMMPPKTEPPPAAGTDPAARRAFAAAADDELVAQVSRCDQAAFAELVRRYHGSLLRVALAFVRDRDVAEEVVQDTWLGVLDGLDGFDGRASLRTWIFRILTNRAKTRSERESRCVPFSALGGCEADEKDAGLDSARFDTKAMWQDPPHPWAAQTAEELLRFGEARKVMEDTMSTLSEAQRAVITLRDLEGVGPEETCSLLEITMANQRVLLHRARARVRGALERHFRGVRSC